MAEGTSRKGRWRGIFPPLSWLLCCLCFSTTGCGVEEGRSWWTALWLTPEQQAHKLVEAGRYAEATELFPDSFRKGIALFRADEFEAAGIAFAGVPFAEGHFNRGNALIFQGKYEDAMKAFDQALLQRSDWKEAKENREIARLRAERMKQEGGEGTGGKLEADDYVFNEGGDKKAGQDQDEVVEMEGGETLSDEELRALWLRRVQTSPGDFLRSKFAYQLQRREKGDAK
jgi:Ca-activated chloride channel family protein